MQQQKQIIVNLNEFLNRFIYFRNQNITQQDLDSAYTGVSDFVSTKIGNINLTLELQTNAVYLACAHFLYLELNPNLLGGMVNSTSQGSESVGFQQKPVKNWLDYYLGLTPYGMRLLAILQSVQPPIVNKSLNLYPYYNYIGNRGGNY